MAEPSQGAVEAAAKALWIVARDGMWPDGSSGPKTAFFCPELSCSDLPGVIECSHGLRGEPVKTIPLPVIPASVAEELAEALSECIDTAEEGWAYASDYFREKWQCEREIEKARTALAKYRAALGEESGRRRLNDEHELRCKAEAWAEALEAKRQIDGP